MRYVLLLVSLCAVMIGAYVVLFRDEPEHHARPTQAGGSAPTAGSTTSSAALPARGEALRLIDCGKPSGDVARIDDARVTEAILCEELSKIGGVKSGVADRSQARAVLDRLIDAILVRRALATAGAEVTEREVDDALQKLLVPEQDRVVVREQMRARLELDKLVASRTKIEVTEAEVDAELAAGAPGIDRGQGIRADGWVARVPPDADPAAQETAERSVKAFAAAATTNPEAAAKQHGLVYLPPFVIGQSGLEPALEAAAQRSAKSQLSQPVKTRVGWTVIRVLDRAEGTSLDSKDFRTRVRDALKTRRTAAASKDLMTSLRNAATIELLVAL